MPPNTLSLDWETRGVLDLKECGLWNYSHDKDTDIWCAAYAFGEEEPEVWIPGQPCPSRIVEHVATSGTVHAWNAPFEIAIWREIATPRYGWPVVTPERFYCSMAQAYAMGLPGALEDAALALGLAVLKDSEGRGIMLRMAKPRSMKGDAPVWWSDADKLARLYAYSQQDVRVEKEVRKRLMALSPYERRVWMLDYAINQRGVQVDLPTARAGSVMADQIKEKAGRELAELTNGVVTTPTALIPLKQWLDARGCPASSTGLNKEAVADLLQTEKWAPEVTRALKIRQEAGKASVAKLNRMQELAGADGRLRNWSQYYGAATGRFASRGVQVHNLVRDMPPADIVEEILAAVRNGELEWIATAYGPPMEMISRCSRSFFVAPDGKVLIGGDFSSVEGRGTAWFSGEDWKIAAFIAADNGTGPGIYELTASRTLGIPLGRITKSSPERQVGKVQELAFGYQGGVGAARKFLPANMKGTPPDVLNRWKLAWRAEHQKTKDMWGLLEAAAIGAVANPDRPFTAGAPGRQVTFKKAGSFLWCRLPSGRVLCYPYPKLMPGKYHDQLTYMTVPSENDAGSIIEDPKNANNWARVSTYGGSLMENVVQAMCRDLLVDVMLRLHDKGAEIVLHVHDEIVLETPKAKATMVRSYMEEQMRTPPTWAAGFPLRADCHIMRRYGK